MNIKSDISSLPQDNAGQTQAANDPMMGFQVSDKQIDSLNILPLSILPFDSVTLRGMNVIKNSRFESMVELYHDNRTGSGLVLPKKLRERVGSLSNHDDKIITNVSKLNSFDVYALRIALRHHGINVNDTKYLMLSAAKQKELDVYVRPFTNKLVQAIYGDEADNVTTDVSQLFRDADPAKAREKLKLIASKISVNLAEVPQFLEDYADIYLSISFYRSRLDELSPLIDEFKACMETLLKAPQLSNRPEIKKAAVKTSEKAEKMRSVLDERFDMFKRQTDEMWQDMSAEKFGAFKEMVESNHTVIGGVLCKLGVKMDAWHEKFPSRHTAGTNRMADFLYSETRQGF